MKRILRKKTFLSGWMFVLTLITVSAYAQDLQPGSETTTRSVWINQVGYRPGDPKHFVTTLADAGFRVVRSGDDEVVYEGQTRPRTKNDWATGLDLHWGDFSELEAPGQYRIVVDGSHESFAFEIAKNVYQTVADATLKSFYLQRCGVALNPEYAGVFQREACHLKDAVFHPSMNQVGGVPTTGGWHDAGDYGKYIHSAAVSLAKMLLMFEQFPGRFQNDQLGIPESGNGIPDFLDEMMVELDWMLKMQVRDTADPLFGGVYYMVNTRDYEWAPADKDEATRFLYDVSSVATADFAAVMAQASRCLRLVPGLNEKADGYLEAAGAAWHFLDAHRDLFPEGGFIRPADTHTGGYADSPDMNDRDDRLWAAVEWAISTGESLHLNELDAKDDLYLNRVFFEADTFSGELQWQDTSAFGIVQAILHPTEGLEPEQRARLRTAFLDYCGGLLDGIESDGFGVALDRYYWGSNGGVMALAEYLIFAHELDPSEDRWIPAALHQLHYVLGRNALNFSYVSGIGDQSPENIHHATFDTDNIDRIYPGLVAGGPNPNLQGDQTLPLYFNEETPPALCYIDHMDSWASNENCILYNAPLVAVAHYFSEHGR